MTSSGGSGRSPAAARRLGHPAGHRHQRLVVARRHAHLQRDVDRPGRQRRQRRDRHGDAGHDGPERLHDHGRPSLINATEASTTSFTFAGAEVGDTYSYTVTSTGGTAASPAAERFNRPPSKSRASTSRRCPTELLTYSVTLDRPGRQQSAAPRRPRRRWIRRADELLELRLDESMINASQATATGFTLTADEVGATYSLHGHQQRRQRVGHRKRHGHLGHPARHGHRRFVVARRHTHLQRHADRRGRQRRQPRDRHGHVGHGGADRLLDHGRPEHGHRQRASAASFTFAGAEVGVRPTATR